MPRYEVSFVAQVEVDAPDDRAPGAIINQLLDREYGENRVHECNMVAVRQLQVCTRCDWSVDRYGDSVRESGLCDECERSDRIERLRQA